MALALPWLESIPVWGAEPVAATGAEPFPKRFAALFMACGINSDHWWAKGSGSEMELGPTLQPLGAIARLGYKGLLNPLSAGGDE